MAGHKETPRQKMIGMMYLVLTALLALNVSADILNAFTIVNEGMERTNKNFEAKNNQQISEFEKQYQLNKAKVGKYYNKAMKAHELSEKLITEIKEVQNKVIGYTEFKSAEARNVTFEYKDEEGNTQEKTVVEPREVPLEWLENKSNYDSPMNVLLGVGKEDGTSGEATKLKEAFAKYKKEILSLLSKEEADGIKLGLNTEDAYNTHANKKQNWEMNTFYHTVLSADIVLLNKYIAEVMNIETEVVAKLYENIDASDFKMDKVTSAVIPKANIVIAGEPYEAQVLVVAYSSTDTPTVMVKQDVDSLFTKDYSSASEIDSISDGVTYYSVKTSATGDFKYAGVIKVKKPDGSYLTKHFNSSYTVIKPSATVSADKMNVVYRGLPNPLTIAAAGFTNDQIRLSASGGGSLSSKGNGKYIFKPSIGKAKEVTFRVVATKKDGTTSSMGPFKFRIKNLPSPTIRLAGKTDGQIDKSALLARSFLSAQLDDFLFEGVKYSVVSFKIYVAGPRMSPIFKDVRGPRFPAGVIKALRKASRGTTVQISSVKVKGPDGVKQAAGVAVIIK
jgi:gliding motility-associated protein GldM